MSDDPLAYLFGLQQFGIKFGLENMHAILAALGNPHERFVAVHVAGTNGKGSVTAMVESAARSAGLTTGRYTSPHLVHLSERFAVDGRPVSEAEVVAAVSAVRQAVTALVAAGRLASPPTFFEATTAAAFQIFAQREVQLAVCEVGMGGRLDATNVLSPVVSAITSIALDHQQYLGDSLGEIAAEKAGIIKTGVPVVVGPLTEEARQLVATMARERRAPIVFASQEVRIERIDRSRAGRQRFDASTAHRDYGTIELALPGDHQVDNARVAICVLELLVERGIQVGVDHVRRGFSSVKWPGRLDLRHFSDGRTLLLDAAHNPAGAITLARYLEQHGRRALVFAAMKDKDLAGILRPLAGVVNRVIVTAASHPRAADPSELAALAQDLMPNVPVRVVEDPAAAIDAAWQLDRHVVVAGSIFLLGDVMKRWGVSW